MTKSSSNSQTNETLPSTTSITSSILETVYASNKMPLSSPHHSCVSEQIEPSRKGKKNNEIKLKYLKG
jgi:hypothetical protein